MSNQKIYQKKPLTYQALIKKLHDRGLTISDPAGSISHLKNIGYYRFSGYCLPYYQLDNQGHSSRIFVEGTSFDDIMQTYIVDRKLRVLLLSAIERIEVALRNVINHEIGCKYDDAHWYCNPSLFGSSTHFSHSALLKEVKRHTAKNAAPGTDKARQQEVFINHYYSHYDLPELPPSWMIGEVLSLGSWSKVYEHLDASRDKKLVSRQVDLSPPVLHSWLHAITYLRNICAHHGRLFGRKLVIRPSQAKNLPLDQENRLFNFICVIFFLLKKVSPETTWLDIFFDETKELTALELENYGFSEDWYDHDFWIG